LNIASRKSMDRSESAWKNASRWSKRPWNTRINLGLPRQRPRTNSPYPLGHLKRTTYRCQPACAISLRCGFGGLSLCQDHDQ
jgi:hypothetical protein